MHRNSTIALLKNTADKDDGGTIATDDVVGLSAFDGIADHEDEDPKQNFRNNLYPVITTPDDPEKQLYLSRNYLPILSSNTHSTYSTQKFLEEAITVIKPKGVVLGKKKRGYYVPFIESLKQLLSMPELADILNKQPIMIQPATAQSLKQLKLIIMIVNFVITIRELNMVNTVDVPPNDIFDVNLPVYEVPQRIIVYGIKYTPNMVMMTNKNHFPRFPTFVKVTNIYLSYKYLVQQHNIIFRGQQYCVMDKGVGLASLEIAPAANEIFFNLYDIS
ncbi:unnamed protein product [Didymodactylos carnosus]|uniref:Uncharacterized protein n=1 Tax=Didymodactylos carnosus TaxID=1234261 RepID=A0A815MKZ6_9BILA|nr:unnamed protein product [Didymodactylos carnosus]CAF1424126.1 unnamed protein product [Didymodactylos carnosus]CAF3955374.1 unnamed protein product [Didymodactylos carnosus]CAF4305657.1 unnamed protein product [Didymodactylos carnosus]